MRSRVQIAFDRVAREYGEALAREDFGSEWDPFFASLERDEPRAWQAFVGELFERGRIKQRRSPELGESTRRKVPTAKPARLTRNEQLRFDVLKRHYERLTESARLRTASLDPSLVRPAIPFSPAVDVTYLSPGDQGLGNDAAIRITIRHWVSKSTVSAVYAHFQRRLLGNARPQLTAANSLRIVDYIASALRQDGSLPPWRVLFEKRPTPLRSMASWRVLRECYLRNLEVLDPIFKGDSTTAEVRTQRETLRANSRLLARGPDELRRYLESQPVKVNPRYLSKVRRREPGVRRGAR